MQSGKKKDDDLQLIPPSTEIFITEMKKHLNNSADLVSKKLSPKITLFYFDTLIEKQMLHQDIIAKLEGVGAAPDSILDAITIGSTNKHTDIKDAAHQVLKGCVLIHADGHVCTISASITTTANRSLAKPENESQVLGAQLAFNESLATNISLIRRYITNPNLCNESFSLGVQTQTAVSFMYIKGLADDEMVNVLRKRIEGIKIDAILDSAFLVQMLEENSLAIFPQIVLSERPDRTCSWLLNGKLVVLVDGSVQAIGCPQSFIEFFQSMEDQNVRWQIATFLRLLRIFAMVVSIFFTAIYVAALTFHYEIIPQTLLIPLGESRSKVPFPPIIEALLLEMMIELLREAGARLPTKVGQTMGIVGGIVVGTAAVDAGFTSNILIIIIAVSALASFTTPSYMMGNIIRVLRFPLILLAGFWGFYGLIIGFCFLLIHLLKLSSLGSPFLAPFYPPRLADWRDSIVRLPPGYTNTRPMQARPKDRTKYKAEMNDENE